MSALRPSLTRRSIMTRKIENLDGPISRISRRIALQMASTFALTVALAGTASKAARAQGSTGPKFTQLLRSDLEGQGNQVQESIVILADFQPRYGSQWHNNPGGQ